jgi:ABC-type branched-subunit amino acid transport system substrate-binding protein
MGISRWGSVGAVMALLLSPAFATGEADSALTVHDLAPYTNWETFTVKDGLPSDHVFAVRIDEDRVWAGTTEGLALYEDGRWRSYGVEDGLPHRLILSLDVCALTGDLWIGTVGGLARLSGGRFDVFTQLNSGLSNDFVHGVRCDTEAGTVWAATAMGASRLDLRTGEWRIYTHTNTPMHEPWTYSITLGGGSVWVGAWGAGVLEYSRESDGWREYKDPDGQFEIDLLPDDGPINDVTSGVDFAEGILWQATYVGLSRYDGREWFSYSIDDSGLASDFINFVRAEDQFAWLATDEGLSVTDGWDWITYRRLEGGRGEILSYEGALPIGRKTSSTALPHNYILGLDVSGDEIWVATQRGVGRGVRGRSEQELRISKNLPGTPGDPGGKPGKKERFSYAGVPDSLQPFLGNEPYRDLFMERIAFKGAGRELSEPEGLDEIRIGFIGPLEDADLTAQPSGTLPGDRVNLKALTGRRMLRAAQLAVKEANADGGYGGRPFVIVPRTDLVLWGQSSNELVKFVLEDGVWSIISGIDSNHTHVLSRGTIKLEVPLVSAGSTDPTLVEHSIPWLVRVINDDRQNAYALLHEIFVARGLQRVAVLRVNDRDGRTGIMEFIEGARRAGHPVSIELRFANGDTEFESQLTRLSEAAPDALVIWGNPVEAGLAVRQARELGMKIPVFGFDRMALDAFIESAGAAAEGVVVATSMNPDSRDPAWRSFRQAYREEWGEEPDSFAAHSYDSANLIIGAIRKAGLNRARIRDALFDVKTYAGVTGEIVFDTNMSDVGSPWLATVKEGRFVYESAPAWPKSGRAAHPAEARLEGKQSPGGDL